MSDEPRVSFSDPPVAEVAVGVQFPPIAGLGSYLAGRFMERWADEYPKVIEQPELPVWPSIADSDAPGVQVQFAPSARGRLWFAASDGGYLVQLQPDRLILNWRSQPPKGSQYPRFPAIRQRFVVVYADLKEMVPVGADTVPNMIEVTYVNSIMHPPHQVLKGWSNEMCEQVAGNFSAEFREPISLNYGVRSARITALQGRYGEQAGLAMNITVRSEPDEGADIMNVIDSAHDHVVARFRDVTEPAMHQVWGENS